jgi:hypothetical protein
MNNGCRRAYSLVNYACLRYSLVLIRNFKVLTTSGYIQRRIVKLTEDIKIQYDGTVRDAIGSIYQLSYGEDGIDPKSTIKVDSEQQICDISNIVKKLNIKHETKVKSKCKKSNNLDDIMKEFDNLKM